MIRLDFLIEEEQVGRLERLPGTKSVHIRRAISEYLDKNYPKTIISPSTNTNERDSHAKNKEK